MFRFYDDELHNLILVAHRNVQEIISYTANYDYHPPLQYIINKFLLQLFGLDEFWLKLPSIVLIILSIILCSHLVFKITGSVKLSLLCGLFSIMNPLIILWGTSIRWYPLWTFLAVLSIYLVIILYLDAIKGNRIILKCILIITTTLALYTNYQTIVLIAAFLISALVLDLREGKKKYDHLKEIIPVMASVTILFLPYITIFFNHIGSFIQRKELYSGFTSNSPILSGGYFIFSILFGNSIYPWDIRFIVLLTITLIALLGSLFYLKTHSLRASITELKSFIPQEKKKLLFLLLVLSITLFLLFLIQAIITGALISRGFMILPFLLAILTVVYVSYLYRITDKKLFSITMVAVGSFFLIWLMGSYNVLTKQSLHKAGLMDPVEEVTSFVHKITESEKTNYIVITFDPVLIYYLAKSDLSERVELFSPYIKETKNLLYSVTAINNNHNANFDSGSKLIYIQSYPGSLIPLKEKLDNLKSYIFNEGLQIKKQVKFGYDPDSEIKRKFFPSSEIIEWRYTIYCMHPKSNWNKNTLEELNTLKVY